MFVFIAGNAIVLPDEESAIIRERLRENDIYMEDWRTSLSVATDFFNRF